jgi:hypothetical protein
MSVEGTQQSEDDFKDFCLAIDAALVLLLDAFDRTAQCQPTQPPLDWPGVQSALRGIAENLMLCTEAGAAMQGLTKDRAALLTVVMAINRIPTMDHFSIYEQAYQEAGPKRAQLPGSPMAYFVLALCDYLDPERHLD